MSTPLTTNAYSELRKAGFFSGTNPDDDVIVSLVTQFCKGLDFHQPPAHRVAIALAILNTLAYGAALDALPMQAGPVN